MNNYVNALQQANLTENDLTKKLQNEVKEHKLGIADFKELKQELSEMDENDPEYDEMSQELQEIEETLMDADNQLYESIKKYAEQKPVIDAKIKRMQEGNAKKYGKNTEPVVVPAAPIGTTGIVKAGGGSATTHSTYVPQPVAAEEKKESDSDWLFWGILGVAGLFVGVNLFKNR